MKAGSLLQSFVDRVAVGAIDFRLPSAAAVDVDEDAEESTPTVARRLLPFDDDGRAKANNSLDNDAVLPEDVGKSPFN